MPGFCNFGIEAGDASFGGNPDGFTVTDNFGRQKTCPRNLKLSDLAKAEPDGTKPCPLFDEKKCAQAFAEQYRCPVRTGNNRRRRQF